MKNYDVYLFDFDFTLADSGDGIALCFQQLFKRYGYNDVDDWEIKKTIGLPLREGFEILVDMHDPETLDRWCDEYETYGDEFMIPNTPLFPNTEAMLKRLKDAGKKIGIISTKRRIQVERSLEFCGIEKYIDMLVAIEDVPVAKPDPTGILRVMNALGGTKETTVYTGDSTIDANAAKNAGLDFIAVTTGTTPAKSFYDLPHTRIITDIGEVF
ncbi:MAG: HAD-IA family hydrolase [Christensenellaceae bacterium]|nr:HAD-IA family hydrolase [Christensenellaceae bacterium]